MNAMCRRPNPGLHSPTSGLGAYSRCARFLPSATCLGRKTGLNETYSGLLLSRVKSRYNGARNVQGAAVSASSGDLATYSLPHHSTVLSSSSSAPWLYPAIHESVKHLDDTPFFELVHFGPNGPRDKPWFESYTIPDEAVLVPELWPSIAETITSEAADVVLMVQRIPASNRDQNEEENYRRVERFESACRDIPSTQMREGMLQGKIGDCCDKVERRSCNGKKRDRSDENLLSRRSGIVRFNSTSNMMKSRKNVRVRAVPTSGCRKPFAGYWGVVIQSKNRSEADGAYLLKAVRSVANNCSCTHFTLTKVCRGENPERNFINSWLVKE